MSTSDAQRRLVDLEMRLAYQEDTLEKLDAVIAEQALSIARLEAALARFERRLEAIQDGAAVTGDAAHERPPHY